MRRLWRDNGAGLQAFLTRALNEVADNKMAQAVLSRFAALSEQMMDLKETPRHGELIADSYAHAGWLALSAWLCVRLSRTGLAEVAMFRMHGMEEEMALLAKRCHLPLGAFETQKPS